MKNISKEETECFKRLVEKAITFRHDNYKVSITFHCPSHQVWITIYRIPTDCNWNRENDDSDYTFDFYYGEAKDKEVKRITEKIIRVLNELETVENIKDISIKIPFIFDGFVDMDEFAGGEK